LSAAALAPLSGVEPLAIFDTPELLEALENIDKGQYSAAFEVLARLADSGNPKAQCNLASLYQFGWGVMADGSKAVELYCKVARQNIHEEKLSALSYHNLSTLYICGAPGIGPDHERAAAYSALAKELGFDM
jgi:TPR repeat protein